METIKHYEIEIDYVFEKSKKIVEILKDLTYEEQLAVIKISQTLLEIIEK